MKALELLYQYKQADEIAGGYRSNPLEEAIKELEELEKEYKYGHQRMKEALSYGNKAQSIVFAEVYQMLDNRVKQ